MRKFFNRVAFQTTTTSTGSVDVGAAVNDSLFTPAEAGAVDADTEIPYLIEDGGDVEIGLGTYNTGTPPTFDRDTVLLSKISGTAGTSKIDLSGGAEVRFVEDAEGILHVNAPSLVVEHVESSGTDGGAASAGSWNDRQLTTDIHNGLAGSGVVYLLAYDAQTIDFTVGETVTGGGSGATAIIVEDDNSGTSGTLSIIKIDGTFSDNESITDSAGGSATSDIVSGVVQDDAIYLESGDYYMEFSGIFYDTNRSQNRVYDDTNAVVRGLGMSVYAADGGNASAPSAGCSPPFTLSGGAKIKLQYRVETADAIGLGVNGGWGDEVYATVKVWKE